MTTAAEVSLNKAAAKCNFVAQDQIWKDHIILEEESARLWPRKWDFLTTKYEDVVKDEFPPRAKPRGRRQDPSMLQIKPVTPISEYIKIEPSPVPVPNTTTKQIGWRSTKPEHALEKYGRYSRPRGGLIKQLKWPVEAIN